MTSSKRAFTVRTTIALSLASAMAHAQSAPTGPHPRIWLDAGTLATMRTQRSDANTGTARAIALCEDTIARPAEYADAVYQGSVWAFAGSACAFAYQVTNDTRYATSGLRFFNALLDDYNTIGDAAGGDDVVRHDTGYAMRFFAPYSAMIYDWMHDAPGMTDALRTHARARFAAWTDWYNTMGYLKDVPGSNYEAGYLFGTTLIAIAQGGDAGAPGDTLWSLVVNTLFAQDLARGRAPGGVLLGGDWAEGWQYAPLSVLEYALSTRAVEEQGVPQPEMDSYVSELVVRHLYARTPGNAGTVYTGGDFDDPAHYASASARTLLATIAGPGSEQSREWARAELASLSLRDDEAPVFQALADARTGASTPFPASSPKVYFAEGTRTLYARGAFTDNTAWAVFECEPRQVPDHQHTDAANWVFSRGADDLVVDPSPYGSLSSLTGNAPAVDSNVLPSDYTPSQGFWGVSTDVTWYRVSASGLVAARGEYSDQFALGDPPDRTASDVPTALRDWVFLPNDPDGTIVVIDRVQTGSGTRGAHLRVRTPATLSLSGTVARGTEGSSGITVNQVFATGGAPVVRSPSATDCFGGQTRGGCDAARFPVNEFAIDVPGPNAASIAVIDGTPTGVAAPQSQLLSGTGYRGVSIQRGGHSVVVMGTDAPDGNPGAMLTYTGPAGGALHVVVDAPTDAMGMSDVTAVSAAGGCAITVRAHAAGAGGMQAKPLMFTVADGCTVADDGTMVVGVDAGMGGTDAGPRVDAGARDAGTTGMDAGAPRDAGADAMVASGDGGGADGADGGTMPRSTGGCGCSVPGGSGHGRSAGGTALVIGLLGAVVARRRRQGRTEQN